MIKLKSLFRRGQGPSGSKHSNNSSSSNALIPSSVNQHLKGSSSVSSLDNIDQQQTKSIKNGAKDRFDLKIKGSRDKLGSRDNLDIKEHKTVSATQRHRSSGGSGGGGGNNGGLNIETQRPQPMPRIQQQHVVGNNNLIDQHDVTTYAVGDSLAKELTDINFDGPREVSLL